MGKAVAFINPMIVAENDFNSGKKAIKALEIDMFVNTFVINARSIISSQKKEGTVLQKWPAGVSKPEWFIYNLKKI